jgi:hypothetical protein
MSKIDLPFSNLKNSCYHKISLKLLIKNDSIYGNNEKIWFVSIIFKYFNKLKKLVDPNIGIVCFIYGGIMVTKSCARNIYLRP